MLATLKPVLEDESILKIGQNLKYDMKILARNGIRLAPIDDTMLIAYAQSSGAQNGFGMDALSEQHLGHKPQPIKDLIGTGKSQITFDKVPIDKAAPYAAEDADVTMRLWKLLKPRLVPNRAVTVYETLERPLSPVLREMEMAGVAVDRDMLSRLSNGFSQKMAGLEAEIYELAGEKFNIGSPKQLGEILFDKMNMDGGKKTKTGAYATGADILEDLAITHDLPRKVVDWRQVSKLKSTYTDSLQTHINPETKRVHTSFSMAAASTGRLASTDPNLQNIPVRTEEGRQIREAFIAEKGNIFVSLDYSQIELRISRPYRGYRRAETGLRRGAGHSRCHRQHHVQRAARRDDAGNPAAGEGDQFRRDLRHLGPRLGPQPAHPARRGAGIHQRLFREIPRHQGLHERNEGEGAHRRLCREPVRAAHPHPGDQPERPHARLFRTRRNQRADSRAQPPTSSAAP